MTSFQGYARASSVGENTIKVNDPSEKILAEARRTSSRMRQNSQASQNVRNNYLNGLKRKFDREEQNRRSNAALEKEFADSWKDAVAKNWETKIKNAENAAKNAGPGLLAELSEFIPSVAKDLKSIDDQRRADGSRLGQSLAFQFGISIQDLDALQDVKGNLRDYEGKNISIINELQEKGASWDQIQQIRSLSGYRRLGVAEADLIRGGENAQSWWVGKSNEKASLGPLGEHSYASAKLAGNHQQLIPALNQHWQTEYLKKFKDYDKDLVLKYLRDPVMRAQGRMVSDTYEFAKKQALSDEKNFQKSLLKNEIVDKGLQGYIDQIHLDAGVDGKYMSKARQKNVGYMTEMFTDGTLNRNHLEQLRELAVVPHGEKTSVRYEDRWGKDIDAFEAAIVKYEKAEQAVIDSKGQLQDARWKAQARQAEQYIMDNYEKLTPKDFANLHKAAVTSGGNPFLIRTTMEWMNRQPSKLNDTLNEPHLFSLENSNMLTRSAVLRAGLSPEKEGIWLKKADEASPFKPTKEIDKAFDTEAKRAVENILSRYNTETKKVQSSSMATAYGLNMMRKYYKKAMIATNGDTEASKTQAIAEFNQLLTTDAYKITERRTVNGVQIQEPHFGFFQVTPKKYSYPLSQYTTEKFRANPDIFREEIMVPPNEIVEWAYNVKAGINKGYPVSIQHLVGKIGNNPDGMPKVTEAEMAYEQLKLIVGEDKASELIPPELIQVSRDALESVDPEFRKLLSLGPDGINTALHYSKQTTANNYKTNKPAGTYDTFTSGSVFRLPENLSPYAQYWTLQRGGSK
tara:strand:+ start:5245 stop:7641 length:2397 start_codon:yes stop_codon:yes gene_type:complete